MSIIKIIYLRLRLDWGVIWLYLAIKILMSFWGKGSQKRKNSFTLFSSRTWPSLLFSCHLCNSSRFLKFLLILTTFSPHFWAFFNPWKCVWPRLAKNLNCKYKYFTNRKELSRKQWRSQLLCSPIMGFKKNENFKFFDFCHLVRLKGRGTSYPKQIAPYTRSSP